MKYLVIAEKPSVSKSIAKVIGAYRQEDGYLEGGDCVVSWCLGHLAEYAAPEHYDERYENWRFEDLPILPVEWKLLVHNTKKPQFNVLRKLLRSKKFDYVVNACDAGREGEAIFRRVYALAGSKLPIKRLWISSMEEKANAVVRFCIEIQWTAALAFGDQIMPCPTSRQISCYLGLFDVAIKFLWFKTQSKTQWILLFLTLGFPTRNSIQVQRQQSILSRCYKRGCPSCSQAQRLHHPDKLLL